MTRLATVINKIIDIINTKQPTLVSGGNIKKLNGTDIVGSGNIPVKTVGGESILGDGNVGVKTINGETMIGSGDAEIVGTGTLSTTAQNIIGAINELDTDKAEQSDLTALTGRVGTAETDIVALDGRVTQAEAAVGTPLVASTVAGMTDITKIYVYTGSETGYTSGNWYYWNGTAWTSGGVYNSTAFQTDTTLAVSGMAADAKVVGDELTDVKSDLNGFNDSVYCNTLRDVAQYPFGTYLANAYVWVSTDVYVPKGTCGKLVCLNYSSAEADGGTLHVILLKRIGDYSFEILSDQTITSIHSGVNVYIPKSITRFNDVYIGFYSMDNGMVYQSSGRTTPFARYEYNSQSVGDTVTVSGAFNLDFSFALFTMVNSLEPAFPVIVDVNGQGKYTSVIDAINGEPENTVFFVYPGVYEQDMTECLRKRIILIGTDRNQCIIRDTDGRYGHHALYVSCGYFENLTIEEPYVSGVSHEVSVSELGAYAVHVDTDEDYAVGKQIEFHHCNIRSDFFPAMGVGLRKDMNLILNDCLLENNQINGRGDYSDEGTLGALYFHDSNGAQGNQYVVLKNNVFKSKLQYAMCPYQVSRNPQNNRVYCDFINNVLYSDVGKYSDTVWFRGDPFNPSTGIFSIGIGYGNSIASLNNN